MTTDLILVMLPGGVNSSSRYGLVDLERPGIKRILATFDDEHAALAAVQVLNDHGDAYRSQVAALDAAEPF